MVRLKRMYVVSSDVADSMLSNVLSHIRTHEDWQEHSISFVQVGPTSFHFSSHPAVLELKNYGHSGDIYKTGEAEIPKPIYVNRPYVDFLRRYWGNSDHLICIAGMKDLNKLLDEHRAQLANVESFPPRIPIVGMRPVVWDREKKQIEEL